LEQSHTIGDLKFAGSIPVPRARAGHFMMAAVLLLLGYFLVWPVLLLLINSFNAASDWFVEPRIWGLRHWQNAFQRPGLLRSLGNSVMIWSLTVAFSFPIGVTIAWLLARTRIPFSHTLEN
jgi:ABC-type spermidine/putrescine transport system permease subunit II